MLPAPDCLQQSIDRLFMPPSKLQVGNTAGSKKELLGCSLVPLENYVLSHVEFENAVYVRQDLAPRAFGRRDTEVRATVEFRRLAWLKGVFCHPLYHAIPGIEESLPGRRVDPYWNFQEMLDWGEEQK